jgi:hypothetical protein
VLAHVRVFVGISGVNRAELGPPLPPWTCHCLHIQAHCILALLSHILKMQAVVYPKRRHVPHFHTATVSKKSTYIFVCFMRIADFNPPILTPVNFVTFCFLLTRYGRNLMFHLKSQFAVNTLHLDLKTIHNVLPMVQYITSKLINYMVFIIVRCIKINIINTALRFGAGSATVFRRACNTN